MILFFFTLAITAIKTAVSVSRTPVMNPVLGPRPQFVFTDPGPQLYLTALVPNLYLPALAPICLYRPWPTILLPVRRLGLHVPTLSPQFVFVFTALAYDLHYRSGA